MKGMKLAVNKEFDRNLDWIYYYRLPCQDKLIRVDYGMSHTFTLLDKIFTNEPMENFNNGEEFFTYKVRITDEETNTNYEVNLQYSEDEGYYFMFDDGVESEICIICKNYYIMQRDEFILLSRKEDGLKNFTTSQLWYFFNNMDLKGLLFYLKIKPILEYDSKRKMVFLSSRRLGSNYEILIPQYCRHRVYSENEKVTTLNTTLGHKELEDTQTIIFKDYDANDEKNLQTTYHLNLSYLPSVGDSFNTMTKVEKDICIEMKFSEFAEMLRNNSREMMIQIVKE